MSQRIVIISGPTASGKSGLALEMAQAKDIAIINADSLQIYAGLPILSSQPSASEQQQVQHFLYSHLQPIESSSVANWLKLVKSIVQELWSANKLPVIVGGSGMYISKLVDGISEIPEIAPHIKEQARQTYEEIGREKMQEIAQSDALDKQRLTRAYEVLLQTGQPLYFWHNNQKKIFPDAQFIHVNLNPDREKLYKNCNLRFDLMLKNGALEEVRKLADKGIGDDLQITKTLGFYEIRDFLVGKISQEKMSEIAQQKTRNYAKRQLTWFRHQLPQKYVFSDSKAALNFLRYEI